MREIFTQFDKAMRFRTSAFRNLIKGCFQPTLCVFTCEHVHSSARVFLEVSARQSLAASYPVHVGHREPNKVILLHGRNFCRGQGHRLKVILYHVCRGRHLVRSLNLNSYRFDTESPIFEIERC